MKISIVTTLYNSADFLPQFHERITNEVKKISDEYEIIAVDDGSPDNSLAVALSILKSDPHLKVIEFSRNFGHHKAMMTGLEHAGGDLVFLIDVDLEEPPELLGKFYNTLIEKNLDVVYGYQEERKGKWFERHTGAIAWWFIDKMLSIKVPHNHSTVRLMRRGYVQELIKHKELKTAIGGLFIITGFRQSGISFRKGLREKSSYSFTGRLLTLLDSVTSFSEVPLFFIFYLGLVILLISGVIGILLIFRSLSGSLMSGWSSTMVSIWFLGGLCIFCIGVIGLYISRIFIETKKRPYTIIRNVYSSSTSYEAV